MAVIDGRSWPLLQQGAPLRALTVVAYGFDMAARIFDIFHIFPPVKQPDPTPLRAHRVPVPPVLAGRKLPAGSGID